MIRYSNYTVRVFHFDSTVLSLHFMDASMADDCDRLNAEFDHFDNIYFSQGIQDSSHFWPILHKSYIFEMCIKDYDFFFF